MPFGRLGFGEIILILLVLLIVFGPRRLPELGSALGKGIREFKRSVTDLKSEITPEEQPMNQFHQPQRVAGAVPSGETGAPAVKGPVAEEVRQDA
jgi:sec-independent protein translocase protein TatA